MGQAIHRGCGVYGRFRVCLGLCGWVVWIDGQWWCGFVWLGCVGFGCGNGWVGGQLIGLLWWVADHLAIWGCWVLVTAVGLDWVASCCNDGGLLIKLWVVVDVVDR